MTTLPETKVDALLDRHALLEAELARQLPPETFVKLSREFSELSPVIEKAKETADELATLRRLGVRCGQGYHIARPGPVRPDLVVEHGSEPALRRVEG